MNERITKQDITILMEALDDWVASPEKSNNMSSLMLNIISSSMSGGLDDEKKEEFAKDTEDFVNKKDQEAKQTQITRTDQAQILKAKLVMMKMSMKDDE